MQKYSEAFLLFSGCCFVGPDDAAVDLLVTHFLEIIPTIVAGTWKHSLIGLSSKELEKLTGIKRVRKQRKRKTATETEEHDAKQEEKASSKKSEYKWILSDLKSL